MPRPFTMVAPNGARRDKTDHAALPVTIPEIVEAAQACHAAGADAMHLHVRDDKGRHSLDTGRYREALDELGRAVPGMRVQVTTESAAIYDVPAQLGCLAQLRPAWASVSVREIAREPHLAERVFGTCHDNGTEVQHILYDTEDIALMLDWRARGILRDGQDGVLFVLGRYNANQDSSPEDLVPFLDALPNAPRWMLCAFGPGEHACLTSAAALGGSLRVGFENSLTAANGTQHKDNAASVATLIHSLERNVE